MGIKTYRPITPSLRFKTTLTNDELTASKPHKPLTTIKPRRIARESSGEKTGRAPTAPLPRSRAGFYPRVRDDRKRDRRIFRGTRSPARAGIENVNAGPLRTNR